MKQSLTSYPGSVSAVFEILAAGLAGNALDRPRASGRSPSGTAVVRAATPRRSFFDRIEHALWRSRQREIERYLAASTDLVDLERRLRRLERREAHVGF